MRTHYTHTDRINRIRIPAELIDQAGRVAALDAMSAMNRAKRELALPKEIRWRSAREIHDSVISATRVAEALARARR